MKRNSEQHEVRMLDMAFSPSSIKIRVGDTVVWTNDDQMEHNAQRDDDPNAFETKLLEFGETSDPVTFAEVGQFSYFCKPHASFMQGMIEVEAENCSAP